MPTHATTATHFRSRLSSTASVSAALSTVTRLSAAKSWQGADDFVGDQEHTVRASLCEQRTMRRRATLDRNASLGRETPKATSEVWAGRPDLAEILEDVAVEAQALGETHVALMICGAGGVVTKMRELAAAGGYGVQFDVHHEAFGFH